MVVEQGPSPAAAQSERVTVLWPQTDEDDEEAIGLERMAGKEGRDGGEEGREKNAEEVEAQVNRTR